MDREPLHNVQNHINWCWATAAKIVGVEYCHRNRLPIHAGINIEHANTIRKDCQGLRPQICGLCKGMLTVDAMQLDIVEHAKDTYRNPSGNLPEDDEGKARALRYIITGNPSSISPEIVTIGHYWDEQGLLDSSPSLIDEAIRSGTPFIGNYQRQDGTFHSVVLYPMSSSKLKLFDPWDGFQGQFSISQIFRSGFLTNQGKGVILWIQYIRPE
ncbi:hypothetical protein [Lawsonibacter sp. JLR.KK007]|uniref:hypothetical protein n=1 Tax=Bacillota TaxID=1239 RepID=UPI002FF14CA2